MGIEVLEEVHAPERLVQEVQRLEPDLLICDTVQPGDALLAALKALGQASPCPVLLFSEQDDEPAMAEALAAGVHAYVVKGYDAARLQALVRLARTRFAHEQALLARLVDVSARLEDRKVIDRAKGILMRARQVSDDDAFEILRTTSMQTNQRLGQVSQHIILSARAAEDVNRAGQLRMLSQRIVKLALFRGAGVTPARVQEALDESLARAESNLAFLLKSPGQAAFAELLAQVQTRWDKVKALLKGPMTGERALQLDVAAESLLDAAEQLTTRLEGSDPAPRLHVLNVAGRQRMLSQRFAKLAVLDVLDSADTAGARARLKSLIDIRTDIEKTLAYLEGIPLSNPQIRHQLEAAALCWKQLVEAAATPVPDMASKTRTALRARAPRQAEQRRLGQLAASSEALLEIFENLAGQYEHSMQMLMG